MDPTLPVFEAIGALIVGGIVFAILQTGWPDRRFAGLLSIALGVVFGVLWATTDPEVALVVGGVNGIIAGLVASGLWSTGRNTIGYDPNTGTDDEIQEQPPVPLDDIDVYEDDVEVHESPESPEDLEGLA